MKQKRKVHGSKEAAAPFIINHNNIYIHTNIQKVEGDVDAGDLYEYDELQMTKDEYIEWSKDYISDLELAVAEVAALTEEYNSVTELALAELGTIITEGE